MPQDCYRSPCPHQIIHKKTTRNKPRIKTGMRNWDPEEIQIAGTAV